MLSLTHGDLHLDLLPETGGGIRRLAFKGREFLRVARPDADDPLELASFALVPYANRIAHGVFQFEGCEIRLAPNFGAHPHWLHGHGWQKPWRVISADGRSARLAFDYEPGDWPWAYSAQQDFTLNDEGMRLELSLRNLGARPMPVSPGFHPHFPRTAQTMLRASTKGMWECDETCLPTRAIAASQLLDMENGVALADAPFVDHCFSGFGGSVSIQEPGLSLTMTASPQCRFLHVYLPVGKDFFCAEPVTAMPDMVNRPEGPEETGLRLLAPGESISIWMRLAARITF